MSKLKHKIIIGVLLACALAVGTVPAGVSANANSAIKIWHGTSSSGAIIADENCPVEVENELLTFDINGFPQQYYGEAELYTYDAKVTAHYALYNPADYGVDVSLAFPFGRLPEYANNFTDDSATFKITADGEEVQRELRFTVADGEFNTKDDLSKLADGYKENEFYYPEMPVTKYVFTVSDLVTANGYDDAYMVAEIPRSEKYALFNERMGDYDIRHFIRDGEAVEIYVAGEGFDAASIKWNFFTDKNKNKKTTATVRLDQNEDMTFKELALIYYDEEGEVSESDWYNAVIDRIGEYKSVQLSSLSVGYSLMGWYMYSLFLPAGGRLINEVTAPLFPEINGQYNPNIFKYEYLLSPAKGWASFGSLQIRINTPYYLLESSLNGFEKTDGGYKLTADRLPEGELTFELSESQKPKAEINVGWIFIFVFIGLIFFVILEFVALAITLTVFGVRKFKKKNAE